MLAPKGSIGLSKMHTHVRKGRLPGTSSFGIKHDTDKTRPSIQLKNNCPTGQPLKTRLVVGDGSVELKKQAE